MVAKLKELGIEIKYIEVPGGLHSDVVAPNLAAVIEFFNAHKKAVKSVPSRGNEISHESMKTRRRLLGLRAFVISWQIDVLRA